MKFRLSFTNKYQIFLLVFILIIIFAYPLGIRIDIAKQQIVPNIPSVLYSFYYQVINPSAGMVATERVYKRNYDVAEEARVDMNFTVAEMQQKGRDLNTLFSYQEKIRGLMSDRETSYFEMIRIDEDQIKGNWPQAYKDFIFKRKKADENDFEAFKIYRDGMQKLLDANLANFKFMQLYDDSYINLTILMTPEGFTPNSLKLFEERVSSLNVQFNEIERLYKEGVYSKDLFEYIRMMNDSMGLFRKYSQALVAGDKIQTDKILAKFKKKKEVKDYYEAIELWVKEKAQPIFTAQNEKHRASLDLYQQAYFFARNQNLPILSAWPNGSPGEAPKKKIF